MSQKLPTSAKYDGIEEKGIKSLRESTAQAMTDVDPNFARRLTGHIVPSYASRSALFSVLCGLNDAATGNGIDVWLADRDLPLHVTCLEAKFNGELPVELAEMHRRFDLVRTMPQIAEVRAMLTNMRVVFDRYIIAGSVIMLAATDIPHAVLMARSKLAAVYRELGLEPLPMENILHTTLCRFRSLGEHSDQPAFCETVEMMHGSWRPFETTIQAVWFMQSSQMFQP